MQNTPFFILGTTIVAEETNGNITVYIYEKNLHGDIVAIYSDTGVKLVTYTYNSNNGKLKSITYGNGLNYLHNYYFSFGY